MNSKIIRLLIREAIIYNWPSIKDLKVMKSIARSKRLNKSEELNFLSRMIRYYQANGRDIELVKLRFPHRQIKRYIKQNDSLFIKDEEESSSED
jgi:hypothetical protein